MKQLSLFGNEEAKAEMVRPKYDAFEAVSAFHKELRLGDEEKACYWADIVLAARGMWYTLRYLYTVCFEETYNAELFVEIGKELPRYKRVSKERLFELVIMFCRSKKKWEIPEAVELMKHQRKFTKLAQKEIKARERRFDDVPEYAEKWKKFMEGELLHETYYDYEIMAFFEDAFRTGNIPRMIWAVQWGDGHWQDWAKHLPSMIEDIGTNERLDKFVKTLERNASVAVWGYMLYALFELATGRMPEPDLAQVSKEELEAMVARVESMEPLEIPLYALDHHTRRGKRLYYENRPLPNVPNPNFDFRYSGHWAAMLWRWEAIRQHGTIRVPWESVKLNPDEFWYYMRGEE